MLQSPQDAPRAVPDALHCVRLRAARLSPATSGRPGAVTGRPLRGPTALQPYGRPARAGGNARDGRMG